MVLHVMAWYCIILLGIAWYCMVLHGIFFFYHLYFERRELGPLHDWYDNRNRECQVFGYDKVPVNTAELAESLSYEYWQVWRLLTLDLQQSSTIRLLYIYIHQPSKKFFAGRPEAFFELFFRFLQQEYRNYLSSETDEAEWISEMKWNWLFNALENWPWKNGPR